MVLAWLIMVPLIGGLLAWVFGAKNSLWPRCLSLAALFIDVILFLTLWTESSSVFAFNRGTWLAELNTPWIPQLGIGIHLAVDGLSLVLVGLTLFLGILSVISSWTEIRDRVGFFHLNMMAILSGILGVFLALDLFLFYFFWELMLIPMYFLIRIWGHENRTYASFKFFIFTQTGGLFMMLSILGLYFVHGGQTGVYTFDYSLLLGTAFPPDASFWLMTGFLVSFLVKLPAFPFHPWLPDAHTEAPTGGSVILAGLLLKTGAYGLLRFVIPLFPDSTAEAAPIILILAVTGIIYGAVLSFAQNDLKRLVAYTSVSHMGFVLLGIYAGNVTASEGAVIGMLAHGISTGALFIIAGLIQERLHTRDMERMGGFWSAAPRLSGMAMLFGLASLGLPGFGNFVAEFLILIGTFRTNQLITVAAASGLVFSAVYALWMVQRAFQGEYRGPLRLPDLSGRETAVMTALVIAIFWLGFYPGPVLNMISPTLTRLEQEVPQLMETNAAGQGPAGTRQTLNNAETLLGGEKRDIAGHPPGIDREQHMPVLTNGANL